MGTGSKKRKIDILRGPIWKGLLQFSMPVAATAILAQLFNASDIAVVGNFTGEGSTVAVAAVGANSPIIGLTVILLYNFEAAIFRSVGETKIPLIALASSGVLNVILNVFFVVVLHMTVDGVAIATVVSNAVSSAILYRSLRHTAKEIHVEPRFLRIDMASLKRILRIGLPAGIQSAVFAVSNIVIQSAINSLGTIVMAASSAAFNVEIISYNVVNSFSQACTTFVGQNFGAGDLKRCKKTLKFSLLEGGIALGAAIVLILFFGRSLGVSQNLPN